MAKRLDTSGSLDDVIRRVEAEVQAAINAGIKEMHNAAGQLAAHGADHMRKIIQHKGTYKPYQFRGSTRYSSKPGEPPAAITGAGATLYPSIYSNVTSTIGSNPATAEFGSTAEFAADLEYGGLSSGGYPMAPRPFLRPAKIEVERIARNDIYKRLVRTYARRFKRVGIKVQYDMEI